MLVDLQARLKFQPKQCVLITARRRGCFRYESLRSQAINLLLALQKQGYHSSAQKTGKNYVRKN